MFDAVPVEYLTRDGERWTGAELERLRREYPAAARRGAVARLAAALGRTPQALRGVAHRGRLTVRRRLSARQLGRLRELLAAGSTYRAAARALRVHDSTVARYARKLGLRTAWDSRAPRPGRGPRIAARLRGLAWGRECDNWPQAQRECRLRRYAGLGYPPGVSCEGQRAVFDLARRRGGVTGPECDASPLPSARRSLRELVGVGALERHDRAGSAVATRRVVAVYRVPPWLDRPARAAAGAV